MTARTEQDDHDLFVHPPVLGNLRPLQDKDADALFRCGQDVATQRYTAIPEDYTLEMARDFIGKQQLAWAICDDNDDFCGCIDFRPDRTTGEPDDAPFSQGSIGYHCAPWARGKGLTAAALQRVIEWAHSEGIVRVWLQAEVANAASRRVAEKAGMEFEGITRAGAFGKSGFADMAVYSSVRLPVPPSA